MTANGREVRRPVVPVIPSGVARTLTTFRAREGRRPTGEAVVAVVGVAH